MKFEYLKEFVKAAQADEMQFGAKAMGISSSVLSKHIKSLEQELDVPLFEHSRKSKLSRYGEIFLHFAKRLTNLQEEYFKSFEQYNEPEITIGLSPAMFKELTGRIVEEFLYEFTGRIKVIEADNERLSEMVANGTLNLAFIRSQLMLERHPELVYMPAFRDRMVAALSPNHKLAQKETINLEDLKNETVYLHAENSVECKAFEKMCLDCGAQPKINFASTYTIYEAVKSCEGISLFCSAPAKTVHMQNNLVYIPIEPEIITLVDIVFKTGKLPELGWELIKKVHH